MFYLIFVFCTFKLSPVSCIVTNDIVAMETVWYMFYSAKNVLNYECRLKCAWDLLAKSVVKLFSDTIVVIQSKNNVVLPTIMYTLNVANNKTEYHILLQKIHAEIEMHTNFQS